MPSFDRKRNGMVPPAVRFKILGVAVTIEKA
jgi:hypothetical protein